MSDVEKGELELSARPARSNRIQRYSLYSMGKIGQITRLGLTRRREAAPPVVDPQRIESAQKVGATIAEMNIRQSKTSPLASKPSTPA